MDQNKCKSCSREVIISAKCDNLLKCVVCDRFFHGNCLNLSPSICKFLCTSKNCLWSCDECCNGDSVLNQILSQLKSLQQQLKETSDKIKTIEESSRKRTLADVFRDEANAYTPSPKVIKVSHAPKIAPVIVIKSKSNDINIDIQSSVKKVLDPLSDPISRMRKTKTNKVVVECNSERDVDQIKEKLSQKLGNELEVDRPKSSTPTIKVIGIHDYESKEKLIQYIRKQNDQVITNSSVLNVLQVNTLPTYTTAVIETDHNTFTKIMAKQKLMIQWDSCKVYENINPKRCFKCNKFGHYAKDCEQSDFTCPKCCGNHSVKECNSNEIICANCVEANKTRNLGLPTNHFAWSMNCPVMQRRLKNVKKNIRYTK